MPTKVLQLKPEQNAIGYIGGRVENTSIDEELYLVDELGNLLDVVKPQCGIVYQWAASRRKDGRPNFDRRGFPLPPTPEQWRFTAAANGWTRAAPDAPAPAVAGAGTGARRIELAVNSPRLVDGGTFNERWVNARDEWVEARANTARGGRTVEELIEAMPLAPPPPVQGPWTGARKVEID